MFNIILYCDRSGPDGHVVVVRANMVGCASRVRRQQAVVGRTSLATHPDSAPAVQAQNLPSTSRIQMANCVAQRDRLHRIALDRRLRVLPSALRIRSNKNHTVQ